MIKKYIKKAHMNLTWAENCYIMRPVKQKYGVMNLNREVIDLAGKKNIPMRVVKEETGLTARQIRYYDEVGLVFPERTKGNQRLFSEEDVARMKKIKELLEQGYTIEAIKAKLKQPSPIKGPSAGISSDWVNRLNKGDLSSLYPVSNRSYFKEKIKRSKE